MTHATQYQGFLFESGSRDDILDRIESAAAGSFGYVITPNVDFVTRAARDPAVAAVYAGAAMQLCDSRVLARLAQLRGVRLDLHPGSDLVPQLLTERSSGHRIALIGPSVDVVATLQARYPEARLTCIETPAVMAPGSPQWEAAVAATRDADWDIGLVCLGSPKQELFARALRDAGRRLGVALCVGAAVDFLTGRQKRAPRWMQRAGLEWLHRLAGNPRRLARRYLVDGPLIFALALRSADRRVP